MEKDITVGITGGIGSGKSVVSRVLRCNGFFVYDCDSEAKSLMTHDFTLQASLRKELGDDIYKEDGELNRELLGNIIFNDAKKRDYVNDKVHSAVRRDISSKRDEIRGEFFIESAILFLSGLDKVCDEIWKVESPESERLERVKQRDPRLSVEEIKKRIESQRDELNRATGSNVFILNNNGYDPLLVEILKKTGKYNNNQTYILTC